MNVQSDSLVLPWWCPYNKFVWQIKISPSGDFSTRQGHFLHSWQAHGRGEISRSLGLQFSPSAVMSHFLLKVLSPNSHPLKYGSRSCSVLPDRTAVRESSWNFVTLTCPWGGICISLKLRNHTYVWALLWQDNRCKNRVVEGDDVPKSDHVLFGESQNLLYLSHHLLTPTSLTPSHYYQIFITK